MKFQIEHACLALAIVNAVVTGLALVGSILTVFVFIGSMLGTETDKLLGDATYQGSEKLLVSDKTIIYTFAGTFIAVVTVGSLIAFVFSVLLCNGIYNRRPGQVKAYFIYGVVTTAVAANATAAILLDGRDPQTGLLWLLGCVINSLFLVLVYKTYTKLGRQTLFEKHVRLIES